MLRGCRSWRSSIRAAATSASIANRVLTGAPVSTLHVINWKSEDNELMRAEVPLWLARFSSVNLLSQLGVAPDRYSLTVKDIERYGPGIIADYRSPGTFRVLVWVD